MVLRTLIHHVLLRVVRFRGLGLDHDGGVTALIVLRLVSDGTNDVAGVESDGSSQSCQGCNEHRDDDFDDFGFVHSAC